MTATYADAMAYGTAQYADVIALLTQAGLPTHFTQTGGMCAALQVTIEGGYLLVTDAEDSLSWNREDHRGWMVGRYRPETEDDGAAALRSTPDGSAAALLPVVRDVLGVPTRN